jgi:hypothetical protein
MATMMKTDNREGGSKTSPGGCYEEDEQEKKREVKLHSTIVVKKMTPPQKRSEIPLNGCCEENEHKEKKGVSEAPPSGLCIDLKHNKWVEVCSTRLLLQ